LKMNLSILTKEFISALNVMRHFTKEGLRLPLAWEITF